VNSDPDDWKPMSSVGPGVLEIPIQTTRAHRVFYVATFEEAVYVLHAFREEDAHDGDVRRHARAESVSRHPRTCSCCADLLIQLQQVIAARRLTQAAVATRLRVTQPRVSDLLRGRIDLFSTDSLIDMLARLHVQVRLVLKPTRRRAA
jgi:predicted XRE-type DNA-binding protein